MKNIIGLLLFLVTTVCVFATDDHGNDRASATPINQNSTTRSRINTEGDIDYFKIEIPRAGTLVFYTTGTLDTVGYLYNASGGQITLSRYHGPGWRNFKIRREVTAGTYYIKVRDFLGTHVGSYTLVCDCTADNHGDNYGTATIINPNSTTQGRIDKSIRLGIRDRDYFKIQIPRTGTLTLYTIGSTDTNTYLYDANGYLTSGIGSSNKIIRRVTAGTYYLSISGDSVEITGNYTLTSRFAPLISLSSVTQDRIVTPGTSNDYRIEIPSAGTLTLYTTGSMDTYGYLLDANGEQITSDGSWNNFRISRSVSAGVYHVRVRHYNPHRTGSYSLVSQFTPNQTDHTQGPTNTPLRISTYAFGSGCITNIGDYAKKQTCNASSTQQKLEYSNNHIKNPSTNKCLTGYIYHATRIRYTPCMAHNPAQLFSYNRATRQFVHTTSNRCLDVHGGNRTDLILWRCHGGANQQFYIPQSNTDNSADDHGNNIASATLINPNSTTLGDIETDGDEDYFKVTIPSGGGTLVVHTTGSTNTYGYLYNANSEQIAANDDGGSGFNFRISRSVSAGIYYVKVKHDSSSSTGNYTLISRFTPNQTDQTQDSGSSTSDSSDDHGNSIASATSINLNSTTSGSIETGGDNDYFKITVPSGGGTLVIYTTGSIDTYGRLYNASGIQIAVNDDGGSGTNFRILKSVTAGTYYVKVRHFYSSLTGNYALVSQFTPSQTQGSGTNTGGDHGNNMASATIISPNSTTQGRINVARDSDYFKVEIPSGGGTLVVNTTGSTDTYGYLYDARGRQIASNDDHGPGYNFRISQRVTAGIYYIKVRGYISETGPYTLVSRFTR
ncbi:MAG: ricin-type beta-trefoil lectin domain protein [Sulfurovum sp.]|nr:ricin-type beta-trefoil lectin domain protein [Sulfurovum sp.]